MHQHMLFQRLCILLLCSQYVFGVTKLWTPQITTVSYTVGSGPRELHCKGQIKETDFMVMQKNGATTAVAIAPSLSNIFMNVPTQFQSYMRLEQGDIQASNPPSVNISMIYSMAVVSRNDSGIYKCELSSESSIYNLTIDGPPYDITLSSAPSREVRIKKLAAYDINEYSGSQAVYEIRLNVAAEGNIELTANALGTPNADVSWHQKLEDGLEWIPVGQGNAILLERDLESLQSAKYLVSAKNEHGNYNITLIMEVEYPPRSPSIVNDELYPAVGDTIRSSCHFDAKPPASVFYTKVDPSTGQWKRLNMSEEYLQISNVQLERDVGEYKCVGANKHGNISGIINIYGKPMSAEVSIVNRYSTSIDILITAYCATNVQFEIISVTKEEDDVVKDLSFNHWSNSDADQLPNIEKLVEVTSLIPGSEYELSVVVSNDYGSLSTIIYNFTTEEEGITRPSPTSTESEFTPDPNTSAQQISCILLIVTACIIIVL